MGIFAPRGREIFLNLHKFVYGLIISLYNIIYVFKTEDASHFKISFLYFIFMLKFKK